VGVGVVDGVGDETVLTNRFVERLFPEAKVMWPDVKARDWLLNSNITERRARTQVCIILRYCHVQSVVVVARLPPKLLKLLLLGE